MPLLDQLLGDVQIQERRPKTWNEPRRTRLSFVRPHNSHSRRSSSSSNSDEWAIVPRKGNSRHYRNDAETWDLRRHEASKRFDDLAYQHREREHDQKIRAIHKLYGPPPDLQHFHDEGRRQGLLEGGIEEIRPRHRHDDSDDSIIQVIDGDDFDDHDHFDDHHGRRPRREPLSIEQDHDRGRAIHDLTDRRRSKSKSKSRGKKNKKSKKPKHRDDSDSDDDDREKELFMQGVRAGIKVSRERGGHGGGSDRGSPRRRRFVSDDDSDDSMNFRPRRRSRSGGRLPWF